MTAHLTLADLDANVEQHEAEQNEERQRTVRVTLAKDAPHRLDLSWNTGGRFGRREPLYLNPGKSVVLPLDRASVFFGPFAWILELETCTDEARRAALKYTITTEAARILNMYDYDRPISKGKDGYEPIGPHRFPDVTVTILNADDTEEKPMRLHEIYGKGAFDPLKDQLVPRETIADREAKHAEERNRDRREIDELKGMVRGALAGTGRNKDAVADRI
jgi:hypothetical protein